jgi:hypothetical protein
LPAPYPANVDFLELWQKKMFLGQEFLTWLFLASEIDRSFPAPAGPPIEMRFESQIVLESGSPPELSQVVCKTPERDWTEAFVALGTDKKIVRAKITILAMDFQCVLSLSSDTLGPQNVKLERGQDYGAEGRQSPIGRFLGNASLLAEITSILDFTYRNFLVLRLSSDWEATELPRLKAFLEPKIIAQDDG